eukprot:CAMPEP_0168325494 /NCGR_PEP_ID=MMETSP0213-20121227/4725_1 /TAXON_ID=151035 /ORGANISM="Euplotes harpa, Strain FSP1.4" /LENGTH=57 /DNA_ID=CAMNT_0008327997 /DNA_START=511 /DNA_END=684 /DNA_ORIENTATION=+
MALKRDRPIKKPASSLVHQHKKEVQALHARTDRKGGEQAQQQGQRQHRAKNAVLGHA